MPKQKPKKYWRVYRIQPEAHDLERPLKDVLLKDIPLYPNVPKKALGRIVEMTVTMEYHGDE